jgi:hypothetical protein
MKKYLLAIAIISLAACNGSNTSNDKKDMLSTVLVNNPNSLQGMDSAKLKNLGTMDFADTVHDFGNIREGESVQYDFAFKNNGKSPLLISNAAGSCGCTVPDYPHDPIEAGKSGIIKVVFNSKGKSGHQEKSVTITTNSARSKHMLYIKGEVAADTKK